MPKCSEHVCTLFDCREYPGTTKCCRFCDKRDMCTDRRGSCLNNPALCGYHKQKAVHKEPRKKRRRLLNDYDDDYYSKDKEAWN